MADELDFSEEGLQAMVQETQEPPAEEAPEEAQPEAEEVEGDDEGSTEGEAEAGEQPDPASDYQRRYEEAARLIGRQGQELGELRARMEQIQQAQMQPQPGRTPSAAEIVERAETNPYEAFQGALMYSPESVPKVISQIRMTHGDDLAEEAQAAYTQMMIEARVAEALEAVQGNMAPVQQNYEMQAKREQAEHVAHEFLSNIDRAELPVIMEDMQAELAGWQEIIDANPDPQVMARALQASYYAAQNKNQSRLQQLRQEAAQHDAAQKRAARSEPGSPGRSTAPSAAASEADEVLKSIIGGGGAASASDIFQF